MALPAGYHWRVTGTGRDVAQRLASALDRCAFDEARTLLAEDCAYERDATSTLTGVDAIIDSYRASHEKALSMLDAIEYLSEVVSGPEPDSLEIHYCDRIRVGTQTHEYRCRQRIWCRDARVVRIVHVELPGERERLDAFLHMVRSCRG